jgi:hypothetical protein
VEDGGDVLGGFFFWFLLSWVVVCLQIGLLHAGEKPTLQIGLEHATFSTDGGV